MIVRAKVIWEVPITMDIPETDDSGLAALKVVTLALHEVNNVSAKIVECVERPDIQTA